MKEYNPYDSPETNVESGLQHLDIVKYRQSLIPKWIKVFGWIFMVLGISSVVALLLGMLFGIQGNFSLFGLTASSNELSLTTIVVTAYLAGSGVAAYGLLFGKDWGVKVCLIFCIAGILLAVFSMLYGMSLGHQTLRLEPIIQVMYLLALRDLKIQWNNDLTN